MPNTKTQFFQHGGLNYLYYIRISDDITHRIASTLIFRRPETEWINTSVIFKCPSTMFYGLIQELFFPL